MRERAEEVGGTYEVLSSAHQGVVVKVRLPIDLAAKDKEEERSHQWNLSV